MQRSLCYMAPIFDPALKRGTKVYLKLLTRKGKVKFEGDGVISRNDGIYLWIDCNTQWGSLYVTAQDVYCGRHSLKLLDLKEE